MVIGDRGASLGRGCAPGVFTRAGVSVLLSLPVGWLAAGLADALWLVAAVPALVWTIGRTERAAVRPVEPLEEPGRGWETYQGRWEALRAAQAPRWTDPDPAVLRHVGQGIEGMRERRRQRWGAVPVERVEQALLNHGYSIGTARGLMAEQPPLYPVEPTS